jgi:hypothetical protein
MVPIGALLIRAVENPEVAGTLPPHGGGPGAVGPQLGRHLQAYAALMAPICRPSPSRPMPEIWRDA